MAGEDLGDCLFPGLGVGHIQRQTGAAVGVFARQLVSAVAPGTDAEPDEVLRRLVEEGPGNGLTEAAVGAGDENDAWVHT